MPQNNAARKEYGISALGLAIPSLALPLTELAALRNIDPAQYTEVLGCQHMALCAPQENVISLAVKAAKRALENWLAAAPGRSPADIGLIVTATETAIDMSRPLSAWVMEALNLRGNIRSYEIKHACYGGTAAIRQSLEWHLAGNSRGRAALVICADVAMYAEGHSGEPTQGAGAVALIIDEPIIASVHPQSYYWSEPNFDFWRPLANKFPEVNGRLSLTSYIKGVLECFKQLAPLEKLGGYLDQFALLNFHVPFPKMVQKAAKKLGEICGWEQARINDCYAQKILPTMLWNQQIGNSYTGSLWFAVAYSLTQLAPRDQLAAFSYGSGCGAELLTLQCRANQTNAPWVKQLQQDFSTRTIIDRKAYQQIREQL